MFRKAEVAAERAARAQARSGDATSTVQLRRSARNAGLGVGDASSASKQENSHENEEVTVWPKKRPGVAKMNDDDIEATRPAKLAKGLPPSSSLGPVLDLLKISKTLTPSPEKKIKDEEEDEGEKKMEDDRKREDEKNKATKKKQEDDLRVKKLKSYTQFVDKPPFPDFKNPRPEECQLAHRILCALHGERQRPPALRLPRTGVECGNVPSVLDALIRTVLSQNTNSRNSTRAKHDMDEAYTAFDEKDGSVDVQARWHRIATGGAERLGKAIAKGGLGAVKSKVIVDILRQVKERYGTYSLDHLLRVGETASSLREEQDIVMRELLSYRGVGTKTASCVLLFCVGRDSFAVDTHVYRLAGILGWRPARATRDETFAHLDSRIPDQLKYSLHILLIEHGRECPECRAGAVKEGNCKLRKAFVTSARLAAEYDAREGMSRVNADLST